VPLKLSLSDPSETLGDLARAQRHAATSLEAGVDNLPQDAMPFALLVRFTVHPGTD
jgi:hypothetical protein